MKIHRIMNHSLISKESVNQGTVLDIEEVFIGNLAVLIIIKEV